MSSQIGKNIKISVFGQSHSDAIGVVIDGLPAGISFDKEKIINFMQRRAPGRNQYSTSRKEADFPEIVSGVLKSENDMLVSCGAPLCAIIKNSDQRSKDYDNLKLVPRPGHADYTAAIKYHGFNDIRGGGHFSGRLTAPLCFAGALALKILEDKGIYIGAHIKSIGNIEDESFNPMEEDKDIIKNPGRKAFPVIDDSIGNEMMKLIDEARLDQDSVGGIIECCIIGLPVGIGDPMFDGVENIISRAIFGIPAVKGIEFGDGFGVAGLRGSESNDEYVIGKDGAVKTLSNHQGGILGGISNGMPVIFRAAFKPTPSISRPQRSVNLETNENEELIIHGRHDSCIVPRAVPVVEAVTALAVLDLIMQ
ncbi:MAG: chorismate synthase [Eubacteriales bacterium]|nr:chorismate synthase [Eubacteriales bacterium]